MRFLKVVVVKNVVDVRKGMYVNPYITNKTNEINWITVSMRFTKQKTDRCC
mgnify:CR=1 FL=1